MTVPQKFCLRYCTNPQLSYLILDCRRRHGSNIHFEDPTHCPGCLADVRNTFFEERRYDNGRVDVFWDLTERTSVMRCGDKRTEFQVPHPVDSPFVRGDYLEGDEKLVNISESGFGKRHICELARIPGNVAIKLCLIRESNG